MAVALCSLMRTRAVRVRGVCIIFNTYIQTNPYWWIVRIHTLVPLTLSSLLPSFLRCVPSIETRSHRVSATRETAFRRLKLSTLSDEIASPLRKDAPIIRRNWIIDENQYVLIVIFIITFFLKQIGTALHDFWDYNKVYLYIKSIYIYIIIEKGIL